MDIEKRLYFYKANIPPSIKILSTKAQDRLLECFSCSCDKNDGSTPQYISFDLKKDTQYTFEILNFTNDYIFGKYCKAESITTTSLKQTRDLKTQNTKPFELNINQQLENYTFFYIDFKTQYICSINNRNLAGINKTLPALIYHIHSNLVNLSVTPLSIKDIKGYIGLQKKISKIDLSFISVDTDYMRNVDDIVNATDDINTLNVSFTLKQNNSHFIENIIERLPVLKKKYKKIALTYENDDGLEDFVDVLNALYTKKVSIKITDNLVKNPNSIRQILCDEIRKVNL